MKKLGLTLIAAALLTGAAAYAHEGDDKMAAASGPAQTIAGELVDMACYMNHGGSGEKHEKCAKMCVQKGGAPLGLLTKDGTLYLVVADHADEKPFGAAKEHAGENVKLTGKVVVKGGVQALIIDKIEKP